MSVAARLLRTRWLVRAPIAVFRARMGFVFGGRLLLLEHTGRSSGRRRFVVLETVERPDKSHVIVASGFGDRSQWFLNLQHHPRCRVSVGMAYQRPADAEFLDAEESTQVLRRYRANHPRAYDELGTIIEEATGQSIDNVPLVRLSLHR